MNVFIVESPLQLLNAMEAKQYFQLPTETCTLLLNNGENPNSMKQMLNLTDNSEWYNVEKVGFGSGKISWLTRIFGMKRQIRSYEKIDKIFIGDFRSDAIQCFINSFLQSDLFVLDDGTATLKIYNNLTNPNRVKKITGLKAFFKNLMRKLLGIGNISKKMSKREMTFFTSYNLEPMKNIRIIKNNYTFLKKQQENKSKVDNLFFLGSPLTEKRIIKTRQEYLNLLKKVLQHYDSTKEFFYVPHRTENDDFLYEIENLGFRILKLDIPIEFYLVKSYEIPNHVSSFYSTALGNLKSLFDDTVEIDSFMIDESILNTNNREEIKKIYDYYSKIINVYKV
ncbi:hypothetical protein [Gracilibacillus kekensis]|uniref:Uncharacterized protein n=1 Tax=Gracilibacillus kekensis TaxID=1027249 RepID=A0A1M7K6V8_9BACI|nr:hypothetical protein [Gracilibacillus kekensis]SHM60944.1 hypothetical protein SAMN05216179_0597 [Gracilibacillus kekensis]